MLARFKFYLNPPYLTDEDQNRVARNVHILSWLLLIGALAVAVLIPPSTSLLSIQALLVGAVIGLLGIVLTHHAQPRLAALIIFFGIIGILTRLLYVSNGIHDIALMAYPLVIYTASLVLDWRSHVFVTALAILSIGWVVFGELNGWVEEAFAGSTSWIDFGITTTILILAAIGGHLTATNMRHSLTRARKEIAERTRTEETLQQYVARMEILHKIDRAILSAESIEAIAQAALTRLQRLVPNRHARVILFHPDTNLADVVAYMLDGEIGQTKQLIPLHDFEIANELLHGQAREVNDLLLLEFPSAVEQRLINDGRRSYLEVPLMFRGLLIGVFSLDTDRPNAFPPELIEIAREVADQLAIAIQNARLLKQTQQHADELEVHAAALSRTLDRQRELDRLQREFIQNVSHELRTPLALILGHAELLEEDKRIEIVSELRESITVIARRARMLSRLVDQILRLLELDNRDFNKEAIDLVKLVQLELTDFEGAVQQAGLSLKVEIESGVPAIYGDSLALRQLVSNLISNALKFTTSGSISVSLYHRDNATVLEVADTGIGIPPEQIDRIFDRFYQVDGSSTRKYGGVGLGLALVKSIVDLHQGRIEVESRINAGTTFRVWLPLLIDSDHAIQSTTNS